MKINYNCYIKPFTGYRCLRAVGFLSGLAAGAGCIFWLQNKEVTILGSPADYGNDTKAKIKEINCSLFSL